MSNIKKPTAILDTCPWKNYDYAQGELTNEEWETFYSNLLGQDFVSKCHEFAKTIIGINPGWYYLPKEWNHPKEGLVQTDATYDIYSHIVGWAARLVGLYDVPIGNAEQFLAFCGWRGLIEWRKVCVRESIGGDEWMMLGARERGYQSSFAADDAFRATKDCLEKLFAPDRAAELTSYVEGFREISANETLAKLSQ